MKCRYAIILFAILLAAPLSSVSAAKSSRGGSGAKAARTQKSVTKKPVAPSGDSDALVDEADLIKADPVNAVPDISGALPAASAASAQGDVPSPDAQMMGSLTASGVQAPKDPASFPPKSDYILSQDATAAAGGGSGSATTTNVAPQAPSQGVLDGVVGNANPLSRVALPTAGVVVLIVIVALLWRAFAGRSGGLFSNQGKLRILGQQIIGPRSKVIIIEAMGKKYLVGATHERVSLIADLDFYGSAEADTFPADVQRPQEPRDDGRVAAPSEALREESFDAPDTAERIKERLKGLKKISGK